jgi:uncharacterized protein (TIGR00730 family)
MKSVVIYCGSSFGHSEEYSVAAKRLGETMARQGITLVYGGGRVGLMGVIADAVMQNSGRVIGVIPRFLNLKERENLNVTEVIEVDTMHERKILMNERADGALALPGGLGTLDELFEFVTLTQLGRHTKPCGILNISGYFDHLLKFMDEAVVQGFVHPDHRHLLIEEKDPVKLLAKMEKWEPSHLPFTHYKPA